MTSTSTSTSQAPTRLLDIRDRSDRRYPRVITFDEIKSLPRLPFARDCESGVFISRERDDARYFYQGLCFHGAEMGEFRWEQAGWDETYYCVKGLLRVLVEDHLGNSKLFDIPETAHFYLPAGYTYTLKPSGVESLNLWTLGPALKEGMKPLKDIGLPDAPGYARALRELRD